MTVLVERVCQVFFFFARAGTTPMINRVKGYGEEAGGREKREMGV